MGEKTKVELVNELYEDIIMEKRLLGERAHKAIRELETQISGTSTIPRSWSMLSFVTTATERARAVNFRCLMFLCSNFLSPYPYPPISLRLIAPQKDETSGKIFETD